MLNERSRATRTEIGFRPDPSPNSLDALPEFPDRVLETDVFSDGVLDDELANVLAAGFDDVTETTAD